MVWCCGFAGLIWRAIGMVARFFVFVGIAWRYGLGDGTGGVAVFFGIIYGQGCCRGSWGYYRRDTGIPTWRCGIDRLAWRGVGIGALLGLCGYRWMRE